MISLYVLSKRFFLKFKGISEAKVASITKKELGLRKRFVEIHNFLKSQYLVND